MDPTAKDLALLRDYQRTMREVVAASAAAIKRLRDNCGSDDKAYYQTRKNDLVLAGVSLSIPLGDIITRVEDQYARKAEALTSLALHANTAPVHEPTPKRARSANYVPVPTAPTVTNVITQTLPPLPPLPALPALPPHAGAPPSPPLMVETEMHKNKKRYMTVFSDWAKEYPNQAKKGASFFYITVDKTTNENVIQNIVLHVTFDSFFKMRPSAKKKIEYLPQTLITYAREKGLQIRGKPVRFDK